MSRRPSRPWWRTVDVRHDVVAAVMSGNIDDTLFGAALPPGLTEDKNIEVINLKNDRYLICEVLEYINVPGGIGIVLTAAAAKELDVVDYDKVDWGRVEAL